MFNNYIFLEILSCLSFFFSSYSSYSKCFDIYLFLNFFNLKLFILGNYFCLIFRNIFQIMNFFFMIKLKIKYFWISAHFLDQFLWLVACTCRNYFYFSDKEMNCYLHSFLNKVVHL